MRSSFRNLPGNYLHLHFAGWETEAQRTSVPSPKLGDHECIFNSSRALIYLSVSNMVSKELLYPDPFG